MLQISTAHVYLTYPFVLSWSMLEAMSAGCVVIGSRTEPVEEVIRHEENGLLVDFFSTSEIVAAINRVCESKDRLQDLRDAARETIIDRYDFETICLPTQVRRERDLCHLIGKGLWAETGGEGDYSQLICYNPTRDI